MKEEGMEALQNRKEEEEILKAIGAMTPSIYFVEEVKRELAPAKQIYSFNEYLYLLTELRSLMEEGVPPAIALDAVKKYRSSVDNILNACRGTNL